MFARIIYILPVPYLHILNKAIALLFFNLVHLNQYHCLSFVLTYLLTVSGHDGCFQGSLFDLNLKIVDAFFAFQEEFTGGVLTSTTVNT